MQHKWHTLWWTSEFVSVELLKSKNTPRLEKLWKFLKVTTKPKVMEKVMESHGIWRAQKSTKHVFISILYHEFLSVLFQFFISLGTSQSCKTFMFIWKASFYSCILWFNVCYTLHGHDCKCTFISKNTVAGCLLTINSIWCFKCNLSLTTFLSMLALGRRVLLPPPSLPPLLPHSLHFPTIFHY